MSTLQDVGEFAFLGALHRRIGVLGNGFGARHWRLGNGDDGAVLKAMGEVVVTTDMLVEDVDFRRRWASFKDIGHKAAAVNLSDLAAMGARPVGLNVALAACPNELCRDMMQLLVSCHRTGAAVGAPLTGGDLSQTSGPLVLSVTALGIAPKKLFLRHRARLHDRILVTGTLGAAAAGLAMLETPSLQQALPRRTGRPLMARQLRPSPKLLASRALERANIVHALADISDGLHRDVQHLLPAHLGVHITSDLLPLEAGVAPIAALTGRSTLELAAFCGEDYELVMAVAAKDTQAAKDACAKVGCNLTEVGVVCREKGVHYRGQDATRSRHGHGFSHFQR